MVPNPWLSMDQMLNTGPTTKEKHHVPEPHMPADPLPQQGIQAEPGLQHLKDTVFLVVFLSVLEPQEQTESPFSNPTRFEMVAYGGKKIYIIHSF